jgi:SAM-dependent methyltransferase
VISDGQRWDQRFSQQPWPSDPDPFLVELAGPLPVGQALDLGSGPGRNSLWLAAEGWGVTLLDASGVALTQARERAADAGTSIETVHADVLEWKPVHASYDLVIVANLHPGQAELSQVLTSAADALVVGGHLFVVGHDITTLGRHGPPDPDRLLTVERLSGALPATVSVEVLEQRHRHPDHERAPADAAPDLVVLAWATRRAA